jgi:hypothetical protein
MAPSNISRAPMVEQFNNGEQSSLNYKRLSSASSDYNRWKNDKFFNPEKEVKKLTLTEILQSTITEDGRVFCPTNISNSKWSYGSKRKTKISKRIPGSSTKMEPEDEETNLEFERINSDSSSFRTFSSTDNKSQLHINPDTNG